MRKIDCWFLHEHTFSYFSFPLWPFLTSWVFVCPFLSKERVPVTDKHSRWNGQGKDRENVAHEEAIDQPLLIRKRKRTFIWSVFSSLSYGRTERSRFFSFFSCSGWLPHDRGLSRLAAALNFLFSFSLTIRSNFLFLSYERADQEKERRENSVSDAGKPRKHFLFFFLNNNLLASFILSLFDFFYERMN